MDFRGFLRIITAYDQTHPKKGCLGQVSFGVVATDGLRF